MPQPSSLEESYYTSAFTGKAWVKDLLGGRPERIRCQLGVPRHVFIALASELRSMGHHSTKQVSLEEQIAIFLYTCVTGLSIRHVAERFQWPCDVISRYVCDVYRDFTSSFS